MQSAFNSCDFVFLEGSKSARPGKLVLIDDKKIKEIGDRIPELPDARFKRFTDVYNIPFRDADVLISSKGIADYFEECMQHYENPKVVSNWILTEVLREIRSDSDLKRFQVSPKDLSELLSLIDQGIISRKMAKSIFNEMVSSGKKAKDIIEQKGIKQITDASEIEKTINEILARYPEELKRYKSGETKLIGFFVGEIMKATSGKANPKLVNEKLRKLIRF
jgi:aspartyl-tRNA(Asn)/glutamyl-tRNA(Gln) amidotransferase subunit B